MRCILLITFCWLAAAAPINFSPHQLANSLLNALTGPIIDHVVPFILSRILGIHYRDVSSLPVKALNLPSYGNWTDEGWSLHVHGNIVYEHEVSNRTLDRWANRIMIFGTKVRDLRPENQALARNMTREILALPIGINSTFKMDVTGPTGERRRVRLPPTINTGDFDGWLPLNDMNLLQSGNHSDVSVQRMTLAVVNAANSHSTGFLVPPDGISVVSDIDDILRDAQIWRWRPLLEGAISRRFVPWKNMPEMLENMALSIPQVHIHYLTVPPEFLSRKYLEFLQTYYPVGSLDTLPMDFGNAKAVFTGRRFLLDRLFETYPRRKFILIGDNSNVDLMNHYPAMLQHHPEQVQCILMRNVSLTDKSYWYKNLPTRFRHLNETKFMFFKTPDDLKGIDFANGGCVTEKGKNSTNVDESGNFVSEGLRVWVWKNLCYRTHAKIFGCPV